MSIISSISASKIEKRNYSGGDNMITEKMVKMITKAVVSVSAIGSVILECKAIELGIDGVILSIVIAAISGLAGFNLRDVLKKIERESQPQKIL